MKGFTLIAEEGHAIRFHYDSEAAPVTAAAFHQSLPFTKRLLHACTSGAEIWPGEAPEHHIIRENTSVFTHPCEIVLGPANAARTRTAGCPASVTALAMAWMPVISSQAHYPVTGKPCKHSA